jgi:hypothetical protein
LNAVITVSEVIHRLELLIDDSDAGFVCAACDVLNICCRFSLVGQLLVDSLGGFDGGLRVEFG